MADNNSRWQRLADKAGEKSAFSPRQSTESLRQPEHDRSRRSRRHHRGRSAKTWYLIGIIVLSLLAGILAWQLFTP